MLQPFFRLTSSLPRQLALCSVLLLACCSLVHATPLPQVQMELLTTTEFAARVKAGDTTVLVPIGGTEQTGPDVALGKHNRRAGILSERIAQALGGTLVAPVMSYVPEGSPFTGEAHMRYPGTLSVPSAAFIAELEGTAESLHAHGIRLVVFLGDHGGYQGDLHRAADELNRHWGSSGRAVALDAYYRAASVEFPELLRKRGFTEAEIGTHGGVADTSLLMALAPDMVRSDRLAADGAAPGLKGNPARSSASLGQEGVDLIVRQSVAAINALRHGQ